MTQKELTYLEDAVKHEENIALIIQESIELLEDEDIISFMEKQQDDHESLHKKLMKLLEEKADE